MECSDSGMEQTPAQRNRGGTVLVYTFLVLGEWYGRRWGMLLYYPIENACERGIHFKQICLSYGALLLLNAHCFSGFLLC